MDVSIVKCIDYSEDMVSDSILRLIDLLGPLDFIRPNVKVVIKANLVSALEPNTAAITHPALLRALSKFLIEKGAIVTIGDSPGGIFSEQHLNHVYNVTNLDCLKDIGVKLNQNFERKYTTFENAKVLKNFFYTSYLDDADVIINFCKLKSHAMMGMSAATKNLFGTIPGMLKPEYHYRFPNHADFANMLIDLNEYFKPCLNIVDAVYGMEGNGPTKGDPKFIGAILASRDPYKLDLACAKIIGLAKEDVPTLEAAFQRNLIPANANELSCNGDLNNYIVNDFKNITSHTGILFTDRPKLLQSFFSSSLKSIPKLSKSKCVGCKKCFEMCPAKAITMKNGKPSINRKICISCFCCQEFCPRGAIKSKRPFVARLLN